MARVKNFTAYIRHLLPSGAIRVDVWDEDDDMYPKRWNNKFFGYTEDEVKDYISAAIESEYKDRMVSIHIDFLEVE